MKLNKTNKAHQTTLHNKAIWSTTPEAYEGIDGGRFYFPFPPPLSFLPLLSRSLSVPYTHFPLLLFPLEVGLHETI